MKKTIVCLISLLTTSSLAAQGNYQIPNSDFEQEWVKLGEKTEPGHGWYSFVSAGGTFAAAAPNTTTQVEGYNSAKAVSISSVDLWLAKANGNLTTGKINMGSFTPTNEANYNYTSRSTEDGNCPFVGLPDTVRCYAKFTRGGKGYNAAGTFIVHGDVDFKDPHESSENIATYEVARAVLDIAPSTDWQPVTASFTYSKTAEQIESVAELQTRYMLASFTTNPTPGGSAGDELIIDDVVLVYNSRLASLAYNGTAIEGFDKDNQYYTVTGEYTDDCLTAVSDGAGASVKVSYNAENRIATITVEGNDIASNPENKHEYYVMFAPETTAYASKLIMGLAGTMLPPATENVGISEISGGKADFLLSNFAFQGMVMGDILLTDVDCQEEADGSITLHKEQTIRVFGDAGNKLGDLPVVLNGTLKDGKLNADLSITWGAIPISVNVYPTSTPYVDLTALTGVASQFAAVKDGLTNPNCLFYVTDATLAGDNVIVGAECQRLVLSEDAAFFAPKAFTAAEVSFDRDFAAGRVNTFVLPFTFTVPDGISVTKLNKVEGTTLTFSPVTTAEANTPYLIETNEARPFDALTNVEVAATATVDVTVSGVTHHGAFDSETVTSGETAYYGWNENGEFVKATTGTLLPFRTYLTTSAAQAAPAFKVIMDKPTGIDTITTTETDGAIYDLTGRRVEKAVKGIYIRDGKKVYIK